MSAVLTRYSDFFELFDSFEGYIDFFLLQDIVGEDYGSINFHAPFSGFDQSPVPHTAAAYKEYLDKAERFIRARNRRVRTSMHEPSPLHRFLKLVRPRK